MSIEKFLFLPPSASSHGYEIDFIIFLMHIVMLLLFVGWAGYFLHVLFRFRQGKKPISPFYLKLNICVCFSLLVLAIVFSLLKNWIVGGVLFLCWGIHFNYVLSCFFQKDGLKADHEGSKSHLTSKFELVIIIVELILLFGFSIPFWAKQVNAFPDTDNAVEIKVVGEQFAWNFHHPGLDHKFGKTSVEFFDKQSNPLGLDPNDPNGKDDVVTINQTYIPIGRPVIFHISSKDVMHSFGVPFMRVKQDAIPGMSIPIWFTPIKTGKFDIVCSQLCGIGHYKMNGFINVKSEEEYQSWLSENSKAAGSEEEGYDSFWN